MMTDRQFTALARVASIGPESQRYAALREVMVHGRDLPTVARERGISAQGLRTARSRMQIAHSTLPGRLALLMDAVGVEPPPRGPGGAPTHRKEGAA